MRTLLSTAQRIQALEAEAKELENEVLALVRQEAPEPLGLPGVGPITAVPFLVSWSYQERFDSEAFFSGVRILSGCG